MPFSSTPRRKVNFNDFSNSQQSSGRLPLEILQFEAFKSWFYKAYLEPKSIFSDALCIKTSNSTAMDNENNASIDFKLIFQLGNCFKF